MGFCYHIEGVECDNCRTAKQQWSIPPNIRIERMPPSLTTVQGELHYMFIRIEELLKQILVAVQK